MRHASGPARAAITLIEMLIAMTATLILMAAVAQVFGAFGAAMTGSRAALGVDARLRGAALRLRADLAGVTVQMLPSRDPGQGEGYFEVIEGPLSDAVANDGSEVSAADIDDAILFTTRTAGAPFIGRGPSNTRFESTVAEVAWFSRPTSPATVPVTYTLYRRQLVVIGYVGASPFTVTNYNTTGWPGSWAAYFEQTPCDISARRERSMLVPNTLSDLTRRENRFMHNPGGLTDGSQFPFPFQPSYDDGLVFTSSRIGEDVVLTNVLSFDVRVFDPTAEVRQSPGGTALVPADPGYGNGSPASSGAYVDIGHSGGGLFSTSSPIRVGGSMDTLTRTYCTWSTHYEANGIDDDNNSVVDQGTDGLDNDADSLVDEGDEQETRPPCPYPLRGIEVRMRCYDPSSQQIRQVTVRQTFVTR